MTYWLLTAKGTVIARSSVTHLSDLEQRNTDLIKEQELFMSKLCDLKHYESSLQDSIFVPSEVADESDGVEDNYSTPEADEYTPDSFDEYLNAKVVLPIGDIKQRGELVRRHRDSKGQPIGKCNINPILDTREYEVLFPDGTTQTYLTNTIAENLYSQIDGEGRSFMMLDEISDHEVDNTAIRKGEDSTMSHHTTKGWKFLVSWKDGTSFYVPLREMKNSYPVETADYALANGIAEEPAFAWWVPHVRRKREAIISKLNKGKTKYWCQTHKYGIELPKTVEQALEIDNRTGTVTMLSRYLVSPREGHLQQVYHIFAYLKQFNRAMLGFDDGEPTHDPKAFHLCDWSSQYPDCEEQIPPNAPEALGKSVIMTCYVDADHAGCLETRRSHTGIMIYVNKAPIVWFSKRQNTVESSTFGSEFIARKIAIDLVEALRYKLRMFGIPIDGASVILCDNIAVVLNATHSESAIKRKHVSIAYHRYREAQAAGYIKIGSIRGMDNVADLLTKLLPGPRLRQLMEYIFHYKSTT
jgi:hypothetical protein